MTDIVYTDRLRLRRFREADIAPITAALQDKGVVRMIPRMPWPYEEHHARVFVTETMPKEPLTFAIELDGDLVGAVGANGQLGYWVARRAWGRGIATEASRAVLALRFAVDRSALRSSHRTDNPRSRNVLTKLGFRNTDPFSVLCLADDTEVEMQGMELTSAAWEAHS